jgi:EamA-like transporter family
MTIEAPIRSRRTNRLPRLWNALYWLALAALFWAGNFIVGRALNHSIFPIALLFWRWTTSHAIQLLFTWPHRSRDFLLVKHSPTVMVVCFFGIAVYNSQTCVGLDSTTAISASLMQSLVPVLIPTCALAENPHAKQLAGLAFLLARIAVVTARSSLAALHNLHFESARVWILLAASVYALYFVAICKRPHVGERLACCRRRDRRAVVVSGTSRRADERQHGCATVVRRGNGGQHGPSSCFRIGITSLCLNRCAELIGASPAGTGPNIMSISTLFLSERLHLSHFSALGVIAIGGEE